MIDAVFQHVALADNQLLAQCCVSDVLGAWLQNYSRMEHPSSTHHGCYTGNNVIHFAFVSARTFKMSVQQPEKVNHNISFFFCVFLLFPFAIQWLQNANNLKIFSWILIHPNSSSLSATFKDHLLKQMSSAIL